MLELHLEGGTKELREGERRRDLGGIEEGVGDRGAGLGMGRVRKEAQRPKRKNGNM